MAAKKTSTASQLPTLPDTKSAAWQALASEFPAEAALAATDPKLQSVFQDAMVQGIKDPTKFTALLSQEYPTFLQTHSEGSLNAEDARLNSWSTYAQNYNQLASYINQYIQSSGLTIDPSSIGVTGQTYDPNNSSTYQLPTDNPTSGQKEYNASNIVSSLLSKYYNSSLSDPTVQADIKAQIRALHDSYTGTTAGTAGGTTTLPIGDVAGNITALKNLARQYGVGALALSPDPTGKSDPYTYAAENIASGTATMDTYSAQMKNAAMSMFPSLKQQISDGALVSDLASPYVNAMAQILEIPAASIDLSSTTGDGGIVAKALAGDGTNSTSIWDFQRQLYNDPRWLNTGNAKSTLTGMGSQLISSLGLKGL